MTDEEILTPGLREFACGGAINVHEVSNSQVYFAKRMPGSDEWGCYRSSVKLFLEVVRKELAK